MISVDIIEYIISLTTLFIAFLFSITIGGVVRAWSAEAAGDDTAVEQGFGSFNPLIYLDLLGLLVLFIWKFGWGVYVPVTSANIRGPARYVKLLAVLFSDTFVHIMLALAGIVVLIASFGSNILILLRPIFLAYQMFSPHIFSRVAPELSSISLSALFMVIAMVYVNTGLAFISVLRNAVFVGMQMVIQRYAGNNAYLNILLIAVPLVLALFFSNALYFGIINTILALSTALAHAVGAS